MAREDLVPILLIFAAALVLVSGLAVPIMDIDAAQYAAITREMLERGEFLEVVNRGRPYLDKPPLVFWTMAASFSIFGIGAVASKIPTLLFAAVGIFSMARLARLFYGRDGERVAFAMGMTVQAVFLATNDARTDGLLFGCVSFAAWQLAQYTQTARISNLLLGAGGVGLGMLAKGPLGIMVPALGIGSQLLLQRDWRRLFRWQWLLVPVVALIVLAPMLVGLWTQYGSRGWVFFFWTQSFGRLTGQHELRDTTTPLYFTHTILWAFFPWAILVATALLHAAQSLRKRSNGMSIDAVLLSAGGFALTFAAISMSQYKLPHYLYVTLPFATLLVAGLIVRSTTLPRVAVFLHFGSLGIGWGAAFVAAGLFFVPRGVLVPAAMAVFFVTTIVCAWKMHGAMRVVAPAMATAVGINVYVNVELLPQLLKYQSPLVAGDVFRAKSVPESVPLIAYGVEWQSYSLDFYARRVVERTQDLSELKAQLPLDGEAWIFTSEAGRDELLASELQAEVMHEFDHYKVSKVKLKFLRPETRAGVLKKRYLMRLKGTAQGPS